MWLISALVVCVFAFFFTLQLFFIQYRYKSLEARLSRVNDREKSKEETAKFDIYSLNLDLSYLPPQELVQEIKTCLDQYVTTLPYTCDFQTTSTSIKYDKVGILTMHSSPGADSLKQDVSQGKVKYLIINNVAFMALNHTGVDAALQNYTQKVHIALVALPNHVPLDKDKMGTGCIFQMLPLFGTFKKMAGSDFLIDLGREVFPQQTMGLSNTMCHIFGYGLNF